MQSEKIKIFVSGDFAPRLRVSDLIEREEYGKIFGEISPIIKESDYAITNLESPVLDNGIPIIKTGPNLKAPLKSIEALHYAGFNMVTMANNHIMDYGIKGCQTSIELCKKNGIEYVGIGTNISEAQTIKLVPLKNKIVSFINVAENEWSTTTGKDPGANPFNEVDIYYQIENAKKLSDYVILIIHGGHEYYEYPSPRMVRLYRWFVDLGCDAVIGHHTHCFSGDELYKDKPIIYSLGNFIFDHPSYRTTSWNKGVAAILTITEQGIESTLIPFYQCQNDVSIRLFNEQERQAFFKIRELKNNVIKNDSLLFSEYQKFVELNTIRYMSYLESHHSRYIRYAIKKSFIKGSIRGFYKRLLLNLIRTESHREILLEILKNK